MFDQAGVIAARSLGELVETATLLACQPLPAGNRVAIVSNAGGAGALAADACADHGLQVVKLGAATRRALRGLLPAGAVVTGPVDTSLVVTTDAFRACVQEVAADDRVDAVLAVAVPTAFSDLSAAVAEAAVSKPLAVALLDRAESVQRLRRLPVAQPPSGPHADTGPAGGPPAADPAAAGQPAAIIDVAAAAITGVPCYADPDSAARALGHAARYQAWRVRQRGTVPELSGLRTADARALINGFLAGSPAGGWLPEASAAELVSCYGVPRVATIAAATEEEAAAAAAQLGGPVVLKAEAEGLGHRTGAGGVRLDLRTPEEVAEGYRALAADSGPSLRRVLVQPMLTGGVELMIGVVQEPMFGPLVVFGSGEVTTEVHRDHVTRLTPLTDTDADAMIRAVRAATLLFGHGDTPPVDTAALADALLRVSRLADDLPEVSELALNPILARADGIWCVDVRVRISPAEPKDPFLRQLL
jgi:acyl-CoA synthetase (NDP forming)